jgi:hypothetical protein
MPERSTVTVPRADRAEDLLTSRRATCTPRSLLAFTQFVNLAGDGELTEGTLLSRIETT